MSEDALLSIVHRGTADFGRHLEALNETEFAAESVLPGWSRGHVVSHVASNARAIGRLVDWAHSGVESPMYVSRDVRNAEIAAGAALEPAALRELFADSAAELDEKWAILSESEWAHPVRNGQGALVPVSATVWMRAREVWVHGVDLNVGAAFGDFPHEVLGRLLGDIVTSWAERGEHTGLRLVVDDSGHTLGDLTAEDPEIVSGPLADLTAWACGRGSAGVHSTRSPNPVAPRWL